MRPQPHEQPADAEQSSIIVELSREPGDAQFSCSLPDWNFLRELGRTFGWQPEGTTYLPQQGQRARPNSIKHDYLPGDTRDSKRVESDDSAQWAAALDAARRSPFITDILSTRAQQQAPGNTSTEQSLLVLLQNFIDFARRGPFTISLRPDP